MGFNIQTFATIALIILVIGLLSLFGDKEHNRFLKLMESRGRLTDEELREEYGEYSSKAKLAVEIRAMLAEQSDLPAELLGPDQDDVFRIVDSMDSLGLVEFVMAVEKRYNIKINDMSMDKVTLRQFVDLVDELITPP